MDRGFTSLFFAAVLIKVGSDKHKNKSVSGKGCLLFYILMQSSLVIIVVAFIC